MSFQSQTYAHTKYLCSPEEPECPACWRYKKNCNLGYVDLISLIMGRGEEPPGLNFTRPEDDTVPLTLLSNSRLFSVFIRPVKISEVGSANH